jgi:hypothetical protein
MTRKAVKKITGSQGAWEVRVKYDDDTTEILPCVHQYFWQNGLGGPYYDDPFGDGDGRIGDTNKFQKHVALIREKGRVVLTTDTTDESKGRGKGFFQRTGYVAVYSIADFTLDETRVRFRFVDRFPMVQS